MKTLMYCYNVVFIFHCFLVITVWENNFKRYFSSGHLFNTIFDVFFIPWCFYFKSWISLGGTAPPSSSSGGPVDPGPLNRRPLISRKLTDQWSWIIIHLKWCNLVCNKVQCYLQRQLYGIYIVCFLIFTLLCYSSFIY